MDETPVPRQQWWKRLPVRLSVRALMLLVLAFGCGFGWYVHRVHVQRDAITAIERAGGKVYYGWQLMRIPIPPDYGDLTPNKAGRPRWPKWLTDRVPPDYYSSAKLAMVLGPADPIMPQLGQLNQLEEVDFYPGRKDRTALGPTDAGMVHLRNLTKLRHLKLGVHTGGGAVGSKITGAGLVSIAACTRLWFLELEGIPLTDPDLAALRGLTDLRNLMIDSPNVTASGLVHLKGMTRLQRLELALTGVESLEPLRSFAGLENLILAMTPIDDAGLAPASDPGFAGLTSLNLSNTRVTDDGLKHLRDLPKLKGVQLVGTKVTDAGTAKFKKDRPDAKLNIVRWTPPAKKAAAPAKK
jgi:hypothetical protein